MVKIFPDIESLNLFAAEKFVAIAEEAIRQNGRCAVALAGGSTPKALYRLLSSGKFKDEIQWSKTFFFFGDERNVLAVDAESNFRMGRENLFAPLGIADENIFRWQTELRDAPLIAADYEHKIVKFFDLDAESSATEGSGRSFPRFDLILLGMGADGHTASLFPFSEALGEKKKIAAPNRVEKLNATRLTLTAPALNAASNIIFLVAGADKAETLRDVLEGEFWPEHLPSQMIQPKNGDLFWLVDDRAAANLSR